MPTNCIICVHGCSNDKKVFLRSIFAVINNKIFTFHSTLIMMLTKCFSCAVIICFLLIRSAFCLLHVSRSRYCYGIYLCTLNEDVFTVNVNLPFIISSGVTV